MWYVIPFVILLAIALVLKKRENAEQGNKPSKSKKSYNKRAKKNHRRNHVPTVDHIPPTTVSSAQQVQVIQTNIETPVDAELMESIEELIHSENYHAAEIRINQSLNQNPSLHELYSYLIDIHILQKDQFALKQLINYLRSVGLYHIAHQAEEQQSIAFQEQPVSSVENIQPTQTSTPESKIESTFDQFKTEEVDSFSHSSSIQNDEIDLSEEFEFITGQETTVKEFSLDFAEKFQSKRSEEHSADNTVSDTKNTNDLESNASVASTEDAHPVQSNPLEFVNHTADFNLAKPDSNQVVQIDDISPDLNERTPLSFEVQKSEEIKETEIAPLDFKSSTSDFHQLKPENHDLNTPELSIVDASPETDKSNNLSDVEQVPITQDITPLEFNFDLNDTTAQPQINFEDEQLNTPEVKTLGATNLIEFEDLKFDLKDHTPSEFDLSAEFEKIDAEKSNSEATNTTLDFAAFESLQNSNLSTSEPINTAEILEKTHNPISSANVSIDPKDPIFQVYPEILDTPDAELDLELAAEYIRLGAHEAAQLLLEDLSHFTPEQRQRAENLLNQIAP